MAWSLSLGCKRQTRSRILVLQGTMLSAGKQRRMSRPCPASSQCSGGTMHPDSSLGQLRGRRPPEGTWPSRGDRNGPVLAALAPLSCPSPCGVQSGFWELPRPLQVFAAEPLVQG